MTSSLGLVLLDCGWKEASRRVVVYLKVSSYHVVQVETCCEGNSCKVKHVVSRCSTLKQRDLEAELQRTRRDSERLKELQTLRSMTDGFTEEEQHVPALS